MTPVQLLIALAKEFGVSVDDLRGVDRRHPMAQMRAIAIATVRRRCGLSYPKLATLFNRLDHTTAMHAVRIASKYGNQYPELAEKATRAAGIDQGAHELANEEMGMCA